MQKKIVDEIQKLTPTREKVFEYKKNSEEVSIDLDNVMKDMLVCSEECDGHSFVCDSDSERRKKQVCEVFLANSK
jgi:hypothetical protein